MNLYHGGTQIVWNGNFYNISRYIQFKDCRRGKFPVVKFIEWEESADMELTAKDGLYVWTYLKT